MSLEDKVKTAIDSYANKPVESCGISFWKEMSKSNDSIERALSECARKWLTPPASTISVERLFSVGAGVCPDKRKSLTPLNISLLMFSREAMRKLKYQY